MNILVIGGTGFLGRYVVEQLIKDQYSVTVLTRNPEKINLFSKDIPYIVGDLLRYKEIDFSSYTHVINCSGELNNEQLMQALHVDCIAGILQEIKNNNLNLHWIHVSSVGVYGRVRKGVVSEDRPFAPIGQYEITKAEGDSLVKQFCLANNMNYTIIRPSNVFGIGMPNQSLRQLASMIKRKLFFYIGRNPDQRCMNYVPVEDVALLISLCVKNHHAKREEFIISDQVSLYDFVQTICDELKINNNFYKIPEIIIRMLGLGLSILPRSPLTNARIDALTMQVKYSTEKASKILAYKPYVGSRAGLKNYISQIYQ